MSNGTALPSSQFSRSIEKRSGFSVLTTHNEYKLRTFYSQQPFISPCISNAMESPSIICEEGSGITLFHKDIRHNPVFMKRILPELSCIQFVSILMALKDADPLCGVEQGLKLFIGTKDLLSTPSDDAWRTLSRGELRECSSKLTEAISNMQLRNEVLFAFSLSETLWRFSLKQNASPVENKQTHTASMYGKITPLPQNIGEEKLVDWLEEVAAICGIDELFAAYRAGVPIGDVLA